VTTASDFNTVCSTKSSLDIEHAIAGLEAANKVSKRTARQALWTLYLLPLMLTGYGMTETM
jgi:hypothetical protein